MRGCLSENMLPAPVQHSLQCCYVLERDVYGLVKPHPLDHIRQPLEHVIICFLHYLVVSHLDEQIPAISFNHHVLGAYSWNHFTRLQHIYNCKFTPAHAVPPRQLLPELAGHVKTLDFPDGVFPWPKIFLE
jgi:hypothetical protein